MVFEELAGQDARASGSAAEAGDVLQSLNPPRKPETLLWCQALYEKLCKVLDYMEAGGGSLQPLRKHRKNPPLSLFGPLLRNVLGLGDKVVVVFGLGS